MGNSIYSYSLYKMASKDGVDAINSAIYSVRASAAATATQGRASVCPLERRTGTGSVVKIAQILLLLGDLASVPVPRGMVGYPESIADLAP